MPDTASQQPRTRLARPLVAGLCLAGVLLVLVNQRLIGVPRYNPRSFRADINALIRYGRYGAAVTYLESADAKRQAAYDKTGYLGVGEIDIALPGLEPRYQFNRSRDWYIPGTQDAIEDMAWQQAATRFAEQYNRIRAGD